MLLLDDILFSCTPYISQMKCRTSIPDVHKVLISQVWQALDCHNLKFLSQRSVPYLTFKSSFEVEL
jgi:hypothetical protein